MALPHDNCTMIQTITGYFAGVLGILGAILLSAKVIWQVIEQNEFSRMHGYTVNNLALYCVLLGIIAYSAVSVLLIIGIKKKSHFMILPWLIVNALLVLALAPTLLFSLFFGLAMSKHRQDLVIFGLIIVLLCVIWTIVFILFINMRSRNARSRLEMENQKPFINYTPRYEVVDINA